MWYFSITFSGKVHEIRVHSDQAGAHFLLPPDLSVHYGGTAAFNIEIDMSDAKRLPFQLATLSLLREALIHNKDIEVQLACFGAANPIDGEYVTPVENGYQPQLLYQWQMTWVSFKSTP